MVGPVRNVAVIVFAALTLSTGVAVANAPAINATPSYERICESAGLRAVERADCHAQMKAAQNDEQRRSIYHVFDVRVNGALAGS